MKNSILDFVAEGKKLSSDEGVKLLRETEPSVISEAVKDLGVVIELMDITKNSTDPFLRRKILKVLSG